MSTIACLSSVTSQKTLSGIPEIIGDRPKFLANIRDIAGAIKELLDAYNDAAAKNATLLEKRKVELENHKREFVRISKNFSDTLKKFFKDGKYVKMVSIGYGVLLINCCLRLGPLTSSSLLTGLSTKTTHYYEQSSSPWRSKTALGAFVMLFVCMFMWYYVRYGCVCMSLSINNNRNADKGVIMRERL